MNDNQDNVQDNVQDNTQDNNQNNTIYDNLNIYDEQNNITIGVIYNTSYLTYKKKMFITNINDDFNLIVSLFDENICDILINIYILKKKNKIFEKQFKMFKLIFEYIEKINNINYIDQENFLILLIDLYKLKNICDLINIFFKNYIFKELINYKTLTDKIISIYEKLSKKIFIFRIFDELSINDNTDTIKDKIIYFARKISFDLFMFYNSHNIFELILNCFTYINDLYIYLEFENDLYQIVNKNKNLLNIFEINKNFFIKEYNKSAKKYFDIYSNDIELYIKFKINKSNIIEKFIENIEYIEKIQ